MSSHQHEASLFETEPDRNRAMTDAESKTLADEFSQFWLRYPIHDGRLAALKAYTKARKRAAAQDILNGIDRYIAHKPAWQEFAHASSWLNGERWTDEVVEKRQWPRECPHDPKCPDGANWRCHQRTEFARLRGKV